MNAHSVRPENCVIAGKQFLATYQATGNAAEAFASALVSYNEAVRSYREARRRPDIEFPVDPALKKIIADTAARHDVNVKHLYGSRKHKAISRVREEAAWLAREYRFTTIEIGRALKRDHSTIVYLQAQFERRYDEDPSLRRRMEALTLARRIQASIGLRRERAA